MRLTILALVLLALAQGGAALAQTTVPDGAGATGATGSTGSPGATPTAPTPAETPPAVGVAGPVPGSSEGIEGPFRLSPGTVVEVQVLEDPSLNRQVLVQPDGLIAFPLAGYLQADGKTPQELADDIRAALTDDFLDPPTVTVSLIAGSTPGVTGFQTFYVIGQVGAPGRHQTEEPVHILQALAIAGGPGAFAAKRRIQIRKRAQDGTEMLRLFDMEAVEDGQLVSELLVIGDGDVIFVPERGLFE